MNKRDQMIYSDLAIEQLAVLGNAELRQLHSLAVPLSGICLSLPFRKSCYF